MPIIESSISSSITLGKVWSHSDCNIRKKG